MIKRLIINRYIGWLETQQPSNEVVTKGKRIYQNGQVHHLGGGLYAVEGEHNIYTVTRGIRYINCDCPGGRHKPQHPCKHRVAVVLHYAGYPIEVNA